MVDRIGLKFELLYRRGYCSICKERFKFQSPDMHEAILTRGDARGMSIDIMVRENCVLVHPGKCHEKAQTFEGRLLCIEDLLLHEGDGVIGWLDCIRLLVKSSVVDERIRLVEEVLDAAKGKG